MPFGYLTAGSGRAKPPEAWKEYEWDLAQFDKNAEILPQVESEIPEHVRGLVHAAVEDWRAGKSELDKLRKAVIHNDFHGKNILVQDGHVSGVVDFGDAMYTWLLSDLAVAVGHLCFGNDTDIVPLTTAFLKGYVTKFQLNQSEIQHLPLLLRMRACMELIQIVHSNKHHDAFERKFMTDSIRILEYFSNPQTTETYLQLLKGAVKDVTS